MVVMTSLAMVILVINHGMNFSSTCNLYSRCITSMLSRKSMVTFYEDASVLTPSIKYLGEDPSLEYVSS